MDGRSPFASDVVDGISEEEADDPLAWRVIKSTFRVVADVVVVLVPVALCVNSGALPSNVLAPLGSVAAAINKSPIEPVGSAVVENRVILLTRGGVGVGGEGVLLVCVPDQ